MKQMALALSLISVLATALHAERPNVILVMADDQGWGDTGYNGHPVVKTPNLDAMANDGLVFNRFYAAAPVCSPTRGSVLTGRHPNRIKITNHGRYMRPQETTIAEALRDAGYVTGMFGKWHVGSAQKDSPVNPGEQRFRRVGHRPEFLRQRPFPQPQRDRGTDQRLRFRDHHRRDDRVSAEAPRGRQTDVRHRLVPVPARSAPGETIGP